MKSSFEKILILLLGVIAVSSFSQAILEIYDHFGDNKLCTVSTKQFDDPFADLTGMNTSGEAQLKTSIMFEKTSHDLGELLQSSENKIVFKFTNTGENPLLIQNAVGSCGCTVPSFHKKPVMPGESGEIVVVYKPGQQMGQQNKTVTVAANTDPIGTILQIKANVHL